MATPLTVLLTPLATALVLAAEAEHESAGATPYLVGGGALVFLLFLLFVLVSFGGGREHS